MDLISISSLHTWSPPTVKQLIGNGLLIEGTKMIIFGGPKTFKSILCQQLAFSFIYGIPWLGFSIIPSSVLLIQAEIARQPFHQRIMKMEGNLAGMTATKSMNVSTTFTTKLDRSDGYHELNAAVAKCNPEVVILDPLYRLIAERDDQALTKFFDHMDWSITKYGYTLIVIHHERKQFRGTDGNLVGAGAQDMRDSRLVEAWFDSIVHVQGDIQTDRRTMDFELRNAEALISPINFELERSSLWLKRV